jgi:stage V sporulation protein R
MELIGQHTKRIMEGCKERARAAGLSFQDETLEYIVTNRDMLELSPKVMIPTLYDYWVHDVEVLKEKGKYELYPHNPYETVINTRPPISFYNDNNPDWLNVMIFYHVLGHIDFFQNNSYFRHTWDFDLTGRALADKRLIARLRSEHGRWVDYVIEFSRGIDNIVGYYEELAIRDQAALPQFPKRLDYYFDVFLQHEKKVRIHEYLKEVERYNACIRESAELGEQAFFAVALRQYPELEAAFARDQKARQHRPVDLLQLLLERSPFLKKEENSWMRPVLEIIRSTSVYFQPQIRTKIMNEGWASYWHEQLFLADERIRGHEVEFARVHAGVTSMPRVGMNPYALGMRLFTYIEEAAGKGRLSHEYQLLKDSHARERYDASTGKGQSTIFKVRENYCDFTFLSGFLDQDFVNRHKLFVAGKRLEPQRQVWQYYVKSRSAEEYRRMLLEGLYHPPCITVAGEEAGGLTLTHNFEGKPLVEDFLAATMLGIEYLWGGPVHLDTCEVAAIRAREDEEQEITWKKVRYTMQNRRLSKSDL